MSESRALNLKVVLAAIDKATAPLRGVGRAGSDTAAQLKKTRDALDGLKKQQRDVDGYRKTSIELTRNKRALEEATEKVTTFNKRLEDQRNKHANLKGNVTAAKTEYDRLSAALKTGTGNNAQFTREFELAKIRMLAAEQAVARSRSTMDRYKDTVQNATVKQKALSSQQTSLNEQMTGYAGRLEKAGIPLTKLGIKSKALTASMAETNAVLDKQKAKLDALRGAQNALARSKERAADKARAGAGTLATGVGLGAPLGFAVREYSSLEDAMLQIARQVPGARDETGKLTAVYEKLKAEAHSLGREIPMTTNALAEMMGAGARMEVPLDQLRAYTRTAAAMAIAFDAVPTEIAEQMGKVGKNFKIPITQIQGLADSINYLDDNAISKGGDIIDVLNRISGVVSTVKMSPQDAAALASTLLTLGERPETASTAINAMTQKLAAATKGTKKFQAAVDEIGLDSKAIQSGMQTDATGTLMSVLESIRKLPQDKRIGVMVELVGMEHSDTLAKLVDKPEELTRQRNLASSSGAKGSMDRELAARQDTLSARMQLTKNRTFELATELGEKLRPALISVMTTVNNVLEGLINWTNRHPDLTKAIVVTVASLAALLAVAGSVMLAMAALIGPLAVVRYGFAMVGIKVGSFGAILRTVGNIGWAALKMVGQGIWFIGRMLLWTPIGRIFTAIATAAYLIYDNWGPIKTWFSELWDGITGIFNAAIDSITTKFNAWFDKIKAGIAWLREAMGGEGQVSVSGAVDVRPPLSAAAVNGRPVTVNMGAPAITVNAAPGMDAKAVGMEVQNQLLRMDRAAMARARGSLRDSY